MAFEKWQHEARAMAREKYMLSGAVQRMLKRQLSMAFEKWQFEAAAMAREKFMLAGAVQRLLSASKLIGTQPDCAHCHCGVTWHVARPSASAFTRLHEFILHGLTRSRTRARVSRT